MDFKIVVQPQTGGGYSNLDMDGNSNLDIVFNITDIRNPELIKSNYTKKFNIPATKTNNKFFEGLLYNGFSPVNFNVNLKVSCQLMGDDNVIIDGYLQITDINKGLNDVDSYSIIIYGEVASIFSEVSSISLRDLDYSEYNHIWNYDNIKNSWNTSIIYNTNTIPFFLGRGYVYPFEWRGQDSVNMNVEDFLPAIYIKDILNKIFKYTNKTYTSNFFNSEEFNRLIFNYTKSHIYLTEDEIKNREFNASKSIDTTIVTMPLTVAQSSGNNVIRFDTEDTDINNIFINQYAFKPKHKQNSALGSNLNLRVTYKPTTPQPSGFLVTGPNMTALVTLFDITTNVELTSETVEFPHSTNVVGILGTDYDVSASVFINYDGIFLKDHQYVLFINYTVPSGPNVSKLVTPLGAVIGGNVLCKVLDDSDIYVSVIQKWLYEGDLMDMNQILPEVKVNDFLTSLNRMFNLFWVADGDNNFIIEPRDDMYNNDDVNILDWTYKTDNNQPIIISPNEELDTNLYKFTYSEDNDFYNEEYLLENLKVYGEKTITVLNDFLKNEKIIKTSFTSSPLIQHKNTDRVCNAYVTYKDGYFETYEAKMRISIYGGLHGTANSWLFKSTDGVVSNSVSQTKYPYAGHFNSPTTPEYDINYGKCEQYYYDWVSITPSNLFDNYWKNTIEDIIDSSSHIWKGYLHLRTFDIINLNLFDTIQMNNVYYKINKIEFNPESEMAYVELFKTTTFKTKTKTNNIHSNPRIITGGTLLGGWGVANDSWVERNNNTELVAAGIGNAWKNWTFHTNVGEDAFGASNPNSSTFKQKGNQQGSSYGKGKSERNVHNNFYDKSSFIEVKGVGNYVGGLTSRINVLGDNNQISNSVTNVSIIGNNNFIEAGVTNTTVVGDNLYIVKSNAGYIGGSIIANGSITEIFNYINGSINEIQDIFNSSVNANLITSGINSVQNIGGISKINKIEG